ncbi:heme biosynthesis HemY N-terminal domain-containing protein [Pseudomonas kuykendallii]|uniref:heme biosynthesis protein HemY n=1 Tax=Pseudomonas kuykendallii TaxID=1007099 RepID=UPI0028D20578|nr:heme biosynthesis HemY N-terminal domain-containing protein [Pseudomonas kuykendallii]
MIRALLVLLVVAVAATLLGLAISESSGYVLIAYRGFRYESSLWVFLALLVLLGLTLYLLRLLARLLVASNGALNPWSKKRRSLRTRRAAEHGLLDMLEGRWERALRHLKLAAENEPQPLMYYLGAARAANHLGQYEESDNLLESALQRQPRAELAVALAHAELQRERGDLEGARDTLQAMHERHPGHHQVLLQLLAVHRQRGEWAACRALLPELRKHKLLGNGELLELERASWRGRLSQSTDLATLQQAWQHLPSAQKQDPEMLFAYASQLRYLGSDADAEEALRGPLKKHYDSRLMDFYGDLQGRDPAAQLEVAEGWLKQHPEDPLLLRALARISQNSALWGKARDYYEASLGFSRDPRTCAELARLFTRLGEHERSNQLFQEGLGLLPRNLPAALPATS